MLMRLLMKNASENMAQNNLNDEELFLTGLFKSLYSSQIVNSITEWFKNKCKAFFKSKSYDYRAAYRKSSKRIKHLWIKH